VTIFSDARLSDDAQYLLREGVAPHAIIFPQNPAASVLAKSEPDPRFAEAEIAFGQPEVTSIGLSERLRWIHLTTAGYSRYDTAAFRALVAARGLLVTNSSSVYAPACAEHVFAFMLAHSRRLPLALHTRTASGTPEWIELRNASTSLRGQYAVILGFGTIAAHLLKLLAPFEMQIRALRRHPRGDEGAITITAEQLPEALGSADHVINLLPDNAESTHFINATRLAAIKRGAVFYNIGRGTTVEQQALVDALCSGRLDAAWLDVTDPEPLAPDHPLRRTPNCFITPHTAGGHRHESETLVRHFLENLRRFLVGQPPNDRIM
jgi:phosphoglycerate dehydrogenase-like enzyme